MICGIHGKVVIEDFKISKSGKKICKLCTTEKNKRSLIKASLKRQTLETITLKEKKCSKCKEIKLIENFHKSKSSIDGNHTYCKSCQKL
jgi:hypothetical protein